jgi:hypothetical protein
VLFVIAAAIAASPAAAAEPRVANGGGHGSVDGALFSQFGFGVTARAGGSARGHFNCLMAGATVFTGFEPLMKVSGRVSWANIDVGAGTAVFGGSGTLNLGPSGIFRATFAVEVTAGGPGVGTLRLTVLSDRLGSSPVSLPLETVADGRISVG